MRAVVVGCGSAGTLLRLQTLAFWLSWLRLHYTEDNVLSVSQEVLDALDEWGGDSFAAVRNPAMLCCCRQSCLVPNATNHNSAVLAFGPGTLREDGPFDLGSDPNRSSA